MIRKCIAFFVLVIITSCGNKDKIPDDIIKPGKMQAVLWDIIRVDALTAEIIKKDSSKNATEENVKLQKEVFAMHQVTRDKFYKSYEYYKNNPGQMKEILDSMVIKAERDRYKNFNVKPVQSN